MGIADDILPSFDHGGATLARASRAQHHVPFEGRLVETSDIHVTTWGDSGPRVVMVHGSAQGSEIGGDRHFSAQAELADRGWQVVVPDRPGHGRSAAPGRPDDAEADGARVAAFLRDGAHLVGHSFGGCVALAAAAGRPDAVRSLTLIEPAMMALAFDEPSVREFGVRMRDLFISSPSPIEVAEGFIKLVNIPSEIRGGSSPNELARMGQGILQLRLPDMMQLQTWLSAVQTTPIPLLVVTGGWNPAFEKVGSRAAALGGGRHVVCPSDHHLPQLSCPSFNQLLMEFMRCSDDA